MCRCSQWAWCQTCVYRSAQPPRPSLATLWGQWWSLGTASCLLAMCCSWYRSESQRFGCQFTGLVHMLYFPLPQAKHLQFVSGVYVSSYWTATFLWDLISAVVPIVISVVIFAAFQSTGYTGENLAAVALLLVCVCVGGGHSCGVVKGHSPPIHISTCQPQISYHPIPHTPHTPYPLPPYPLPPYPLPPIPHTAIPPISHTPYMYLVHSSPFSLQLLTCWALIPFVYCVSFFFKSGLIAFCVIVLYFLFSSQVCGRLWENCWCTSPSIFLFPFSLLPSSALPLLPQIFEVVVLVVTNTTTNKILHYLFLLDPAYAYVCK